MTSARLEPDQLVVETKAITTSPHVHTSGRGCKLLIFTIFFPYFKLEKLRMTST